MRKSLLPVIFAVMTLWCAIARAQPRKTLDVYFIDVEGGQSTLLVSPSGQSLLIDAGWPGARDADRITAVAKQAGIMQIDDAAGVVEHVEEAVLPAGVLRVDRDGDPFETDDPNPRSGSHVQSAVVCPLDVESTAVPLPIERSGKGDVLSGWRAVPCDFLRVPLGHVQGWKAIH